MRRYLMVAVGLALVACSAWAGDGIPMGNAVFYPSVEASYTHTDNLFLQDSSMPNGNVSSDFWLVRPVLGFEFPFKESYLRLDLAYQYKDYNNFTLSDHNTYDANLSGDFKLGKGFTLTVKEEYLQGVQEVQKFDPGYEIYFSNSKFHANYTLIGLQMPVGPIDSLELYGLYNQVRFANTDNANQPVPFYDYDQAGGGLTWRHNYNPQSDWLLDLRYLKNTPKISATDSWLGIRTDAREYEDWRLMPGWEGSVGHEVSGYAKVGYEKMDFKNSPFSDFNGFVTDMGLGFTPAEFVKLGLEVFRSPFQSAYNVNNYYTSTGGELKLNYELSRYFYLTAGYRYQENAYPQAVSADPLALGYPPSTEELLTEGQTRKDKISTAYGEFGFHVSKQISFRANYQYQDRNSNIHYYDVGINRRPYTYTENRFMVQAQVGW